MSQIRAIVITLVLLSCITGNDLLSETVVKEWEVFEIEMTAQNKYGNPYVDCLPDEGNSLVKVTFTGISGKAEGHNYTLCGFWDGGNSWKVRFAPPVSGEWSYSSISRDPGLNGLKGSIVCSEWTETEKEANPARRGFVRVCKTGNNPGRYFEYADGTPFLWIGDTWWRWTKRGIYFSSFQELVDDREEKGFTIGQMFIAGKGREKEYTLLDETFTILDIDLIRKVDSMIEYANSKGITIWVQGWWGGADINKSIGEENMRRWCRYLIHRLGAYNVIWVIAGEYNMYDYGSMELQFWKDIGSLIDNEDPYERIISAHPTPPFWGGGADAPQWATGEILHNEPWLDYNQSQVGHGKYANEMIPSVVSSEYNKVPAKPIVVTEPWYEFISDNPSAEDIRFGGWSAILCGAAGHSYGGGFVWRANVPESPERSSSTWPMEQGFQTNTLDYPGAVSMGHLAKFFKRIDWWELTPHPESVLDYPEKYCRASPGKEYIVYLRWGGSIRIDLNPSSPDDAFELTWFDPRTGMNHTADTVYGGKIQWLNAPERYPGHPHYKDWILYLRRKN
ncbi:MAG: DUF4038 domain-containing protein [Gemmatimonadota bacterium]|nr:DUF4038 domain-containing protein [Gemmatimonadota bacterium]